MNNKRNIKDYIQLYIGCEVEILSEKGRKINLGLYYPDVWTKEGNLEPNGVNVYYPEHKKVYAMNFNQVKLVLRPKSYLDTFEGNYLRDQYRGKMARFINGDIEETPESFAFLLKHNIDIFNLMETELATKNEIKVCKDCGGDIVEGERCLGCEFGNDR